MCELSPPVSGRVWVEGLYLLLTPSFLRTSGSPVPGRAPCWVLWFCRPSPWHLREGGEVALISPASLPHSDCLSLWRRGLCGHGNVVIKGVESFVYYPFRNIWSIKGQLWRVMHDLKEWIVLPRPWFNLLNEICIEVASVAWKLYCTILNKNAFLFVSQGSWREGEMRQIIISIKSSSFPDLG